MVVRCRCCNGGAPVCFAEVCGAAQVRVGGVRRCCGGCRGCCRDGEAAMEMRWWPAVAVATRNVAECMTELRRRWRKNARTKCCYSAVMVRAFRHGGRDCAVTGAVVRRWLFAQIWIYYGELSRVSVNGASGSAFVEDALRIGGGQRDWCFPA